MEPTLDNPGILQYSLHKSALLLLLETAQEDSEAQLCPSGLLHPQKMTAWTPGAPATHYRSDLSFLPINKTRL